MATPPEFEEEFTGLAKLTGSVAHANTRGEEFCTNKPIGSNLVTRRHRIVRGEQRDIFWRRWTMDDGRWTMERTDNLSADNPLQHCELFGRAVNKFPVQLGYCIEKCSYTHNFEYMVQHYACTERERERKQQEKVNALVSIQN
ncbi:hypothetical protein GX48_01471 [Paracoccidioides brasiliensis]|nr:hypothetical protein GX48_01471 [Paracoccidioides brasiliensis]